MLGGEGYFINWFHGKNLVFFLLKKDRQNNKYIMLKSLRFCHHICHYMENKQITFFTEILIWKVDWWIFFCTYFTFHKKFVGHYVYFRIYWNAKLWNYDLHNIWSFILITWWKKTEAAGIISQLFFACKIVVERTWCWWWHNYCPQGV